MDWTSVIAALVTAAGALAGTYLANRKSSALIVYRLSELERKQDKHNAVIERTYKLEERTEVQEEKLRVANHKIDDLERKVG